MTKHRHATISATTTSPTFAACTRLNTRWSWVQTHNHFQPSPATRVVLLFWLQALVVGTAHKMSVYRFNLDLDHDPSSHLADFGPIGAYRSWDVEGVSVGQPYVLTCDLTRGLVAEELQSMFAYVRLMPSGTWLPILSAKIVSGVDDAEDGSTTLHVFPIRETGDVDEEGLHVIVGGSTWLCPTMVITVDVPTSEKPTVTLQATVSYGRSCCAQRTPALCPRSPAWCGSRCGSPGGSLV